MGDALLSDPEKVIPAIPEVMTDGRDEMNLAEWPIALIASNKQPSALQPDVNTRVFRDVIKHPKTGEMLQRTFTVSATSKWGLPGPIDDEVLLALIQISKLARFASKKLYFTRYHLLKVLRWPTNGVYYERLKQALKRLEGVQLDFERAYWSEEAQSFVDRTFSLYNDLKILEDENSASKKPDPRQPVFPFASCELTWSNFLFDGLDKRKLKHLDFELYRNLDSAIAKRLYRFLDKRLYDERHVSLRMSLTSFAVAHVGLAEGQPPREYKRRLKPAIRELEQCGFLKPLAEKERFKKVRAGLYDIFVERNFSHHAGWPGDFKPEARIEISAPAEALIQAGMHQQHAVKIAKNHPETEIRRKLDILRWRVESGDPPKSCGAWLNDQFRNNYPDPEAYTAHLKSEESKSIQRKRAKEVQEATKQRLQREKGEREQAEQEERRKILGFWEKLSPEEKHNAEGLALAEATDIQLEWINNGGLTGKTTRQNLLDAYALSRVLSRLNKPT